MSAPAWKTCHYPERRRHERGRSCRVQSWRGPVSCDRRCEPTSHVSRHAQDGPRVAPSTDAPPLAWQDDTPAAWRLRAGARGTSENDYRRILPMRIGALLGITVGLAACAEPPTSITAARMLGQQASASAAVVSTKLTRN